MVSSCCSLVFIGRTYNGLEYGRGNDGTGITGSHHGTGTTGGVDSRIDSGRGRLRRILQSKRQLMKV